MARPGGSTTQTARPGGRDREAVPVVSGTLPRWDSVITPESPYAEQMRLDEKTTTVILDPRGRLLGRETLHGLQKAALLEAQRALVAALPSENPTSREHNVVIVNGREVTMVSGKDVRVTWDGEIEMSMGSKTTKRSLGRSPIVTEVPGEAKISKIILPEVPPRQVDGSTRFTVELVTAGGPGKLRNVTTESWGSSIAQALKGGMPLHLERRHIGGNGKDVKGVEYFDLRVGKEVPFRDRKKRSDTEAALQSGNMNGQLGEHPTLVTGQVEFVEIGHEHNPHAFRISGITEPGQLNGIHSHYEVARRRVADLQTARARQEEKPVQPTDITVNLVSEQTARMLYELTLRQQAEALRDPRIETNGIQRIFHNHPSDAAGVITDQDDRAGAIRRAWRNQNRIASMIDHGDAKIGTLTKNSDATYIVFYLEHAGLRKLRRDEQPVFDIPSGNRRVLEIRSELAGILKEAKDGRPARVIVSEYLSANYPGANAELIEALAKELTPKTDVEVVLEAVSATGRAKDMAVRRAADLIAQSTGEDPAEAERTIAGIRVEKGSGGNSGRRRELTPAMVRKGYTVFDPALRTKRLLDRTQVVSDLRRRGYPKSEIRRVLAKLYPSA